jgi:alkylation response protein AidB-like acyl-CoA dehydrogenase
MSVAEHPPVTVTDGVTDAELTERFAPVFARIAEGAVRRETERSLPFEEVAWLREAGFGRIRVPVEHGGLGATLPQFFRQLIELAKAESNLPQLLRGHFGFVETRLVHPDPASRDSWLRRVGSGDLFGNAQSELGNTSFWTNATRIVRDGDRWRLDGEKYYSTGSLFADWILTTARVDDDHSATVLVRADAPGVTRIDDWDGFGQRLTGSGTTTFTDVVVPNEDVEPYPNGDFSGTTLLAFFQMIHLATLAGIGRAALRDTATFVNQRGRNLINPAYSSPGTDPLVQQVAGQIAGASFAADATVLAAAEALDTAHRAQLAGEADPDLFDVADVAVFGAQGQVIDLVLGLVSRLFEVGGSSAVSEKHRLDRHWRNARTLASHNPAIYRNQIVGDYVLNGTSPHQFMRRTWDDVRAARPTPGTAT